MVTGNKLPVGLWPHPSPAEGGLGWRQERPPEEDRPMSMNIDDKIKAVSQVAELAAASQRLYTQATEVQPPQVPAGLEAEAIEAQEQIKAAFVECGDDILRTAQKVIGLVLQPAHTDPPPATDPQPQPA